MRGFCIQNLLCGGVITTYHCVSRCGHCLYNSSPQRTKNVLNGDQATSIFERIAQLGCRSVHIGGGEPLLYPQKLIEVCQAAHAAGVGIDYVETNSAWYSDNRQAESILRQLHETGVEALLVSISPFHNAHIPWKRVSGVIGACRRIGLTAMPWVNGFVKDIERLDHQRTHSMSEFRAAYGTDYLERIPGRYWIHMGGRALETFRSVYPHQSWEQVIKNGPPSCTQTLGDTSHFHIDQYGNYIPGLCAGLALDMDDLGQPVPPGKYPLLEHLVSRGIEGLFEWAHNTYDYAPHRQSYINHCDLCTEIRHFLWCRDANRFPELAPRGFYTELPIFM